ncbi:fimbrial protein [Burkholderia stabilis]|uniref:fimbrial protein n=1 Tax=Burkholderia stabilis TaxID=95485 RepID=UPI001F4A67E8|nr:fimbrial protein [Burkholderia stabilis]
MNRRTRIWHRAIRLLLACAGALAVTAAHAGTCSYTPGNPYGDQPANLVAPLNVGALTVGRDVPNGTVLYRQTVRPIQLLITCTNPGVITSVSKQYKLTTTPLPLANWNGSPYPGHVYETGVPGIGIALWYAGNAFPYTMSVANCGSTTVNCNWVVNTAQFDISLIKIGPVSPGIIQASNFPTVQLDWVTDNTLTLKRTSFTGSINIVAQTCTTPDVNVDMGQHQTKAFSGAGSATPWKDFSILLQNCPAFTGSSSYVQNNDSATGWSSSVATNPNAIGFSLAPTTPIVDPAQGIVALAPASSGPAAATGVGLQVANASNAPVAYNTVMPSGIVPSATSGASYSIPLRARYVQTGSAAPTPGPANTSMMFTINYQ